MGHSMWVRELMIVLACLLWGYGVIVECLQFYGFYLVGKVRWYLYHVSSLQEFLRLFITGVTLGGLYISWDTLPVRVLLAVTVLLRWIKVLQILTYFRAIGLHSLPVM